MDQMATLRSTTDTPSPHVYASSTSLKQSKNMLGLCQSKFHQSLVLTILLFFFHPFLLMMFSRMLKGRKTFHVSSDMSLLCYLQFEVKRECLLPGFWH